LDKELSDGNVVIGKHNFMIVFGSRVEEVNMKSENQLNER
jgi:hypothetical protein